MPALFAALSLGCSNASSSNGKPSGAGPSPDASVKSRPDGSPHAGHDATMAPVCRAPGYGGSTSPQAFSHLSATVVDGNDTPISGVPAQACGTDVCLNGTTKSNGSVVIDQMQPLRKPAFKYGGVDYVRFALPLTGRGESIDLGTQKTFAFDPPASGAPLEAGKPAVSNGVTLTPSPATTDIETDLIDFGTPDLKKFRAVEVPLDQAPAAVDASLGLGIVVALTPVATVLCPAAALSVKNSPGWKAGARVEFFLHGVDVAEEWAPYGGWAKVSEGAVSDDGTSISTDPDGGIPALSVVGIRLAK